MLPVFQKIEANINHSFYVGHMKFPYFPNPLQFHPEIELLLVIKGTGTRFVGDSIDRFGPGDVIMIGQNVPHVWYSDEKYTRENSDLTTEIIFILFKSEIFGEHFWNLPESKNILKLIQSARRGIRLSGKTRAEVISLMNLISNSAGLSRITLLLSILDIIATKKEYNFLASPVVQDGISYNDPERLNKVYQYVINNYQQPIALEKAASIASLSVPAFCRYFKKRTNKTFIHFLNEIRIAFACKYLTDEDYTVSRAAYICGFTNISFFIKQFKEITGLTPLNYKKKFSD
jgi:AraC-like DNA-binding protein